MSHALKRRLTAATMTMLLSLVAGAPGASASSSIDVTTTSPAIAADGECSLSEAIYSANLDSNLLPDPHNPGDFFDTGCAEGSGDDTIVLPAGATLTLSTVIEGLANYLGPTGTPYVTSTIDVEGRGATIRHASNNVPFRAFSVAEGGDLTIHELIIQGFTAKGGDGAGGGGGGLGAGGAIYVHHGRLGIGWSTFEGNGAVGGNGSSGNVYGAGGGGGGMGGRGGIPSTLKVFESGGGGGGARGNGGDAFDSAIYASVPGGGGGTVTDGSSYGAGGEACGADGGSSGVIGGANGEDADSACRGGGGGGGDSESGITVPSGDGGHGSYGGGGGGGGYSGGDGGGGGFGGGGGAGPAFSYPDGYEGGGGGDGGFGAGGGAGPGGVIFGDPGSGGTFAGDGTDLFGGAGAGLGGAVFGHDADIVIQNSTFYGNYVSHGATDGPTATRGQDAGGAIFTVGGSLSVNNATISGNESTGDGAGLVVYRSTDSGATATVRLRNSIIAGNSGHDECFRRNGATDDGSTNNLITPHAEDAATPCPGIAVTDDPGLGALQRNEPGTTKTMAIGPTSPAIDAADPSSATPDDQRGVFRTYGAGPDIGAFEFSGVAPQTAITLAPATPDGQNGWYVAPVGVTVAATDADSTVAQTRCDLDPAATPSTFADLTNAACSLSSVATDGEHAVFGASVDTEGNVEIPVVSATFKIDQTDPTLAPTISATTIQLGQTGVTASPHAADATSGVASSGCDPIDTSTPGDHTATCRATDNAGNTASSTVHYVVQYRILGFFSPVPGSKWHAGQSVPVKIALGDATGTRISDADAAALAAACRVTFSATGAQVAGPACMKYDPASHQFVFSWKLAKKPLGNATIAATISYPPTTSTTRLSEVIAITR